MASSVYSEVTSVSTYGYERDRVLDKLKIASEDLPYNVDDITISHNDFAIADVYNDSLRKLYSNYTFFNNIHIFYSKYRSKNNHLN